jgi:hypothetical protein
MSLTSSRDFGADSSTSRTSGHRIHRRSPIQNSPLLRLLSTVNRQHGIFEVLARIQTGNSCRVETIAIAVAGRDLSPAHTQSEKKGCSMAWHVLNVQRPIVKAAVRVFD